MPAISVPYHLDEHLPGLDLPGSEIAVALPDSDVWPRLVRLYAAVADTVEAAVPAGLPVTVVSGDCTVSIGVFAGLQRAGHDASVVWIDAHGDLQTLETTPSGYLGGMALRFLLGYRSELVADPLGLRPPPQERVLLVDGRDLDPAESEFIAAGPMRRTGLEDLTPDVLPDGPILLNLDLDVVDPSHLLRPRYPVRSGPDPSAVLRAARTVVGTGRLAAINIACTWDPGGGTDTDERRARLVSAILASLPRPARGSR